MKDAGIMLLSADNESEIKILKVALSSIISLLKIVIH